MQRVDIKNILVSLKSAVDHPLFYVRLFALIAKQQEKENSGRGHELSKVATEEYEALSRRVDRSQIQESCSVRNVLRTRQLALLLIDDKGEIHLNALPPLISHLKAHLYSLGPERHHDGKRQEHLLKGLELLAGEKTVVRLLKALTRPLMNKQAEELIRQTLQLSPGTVVTDAHTRQAVLSAWLCYLRQNVGSCFATAPAEIVQGEQPELFLQDMVDLIATGSLKRTFGGIEHSVPLSASWGSGDLKKPLLIRISSHAIIPEIWHSPGLIDACESMGCFKLEATRKEKTQQIQGWINLMIHQRQSPSLCVLTAEEIIRSVLLHTLGITEKQVKEYEDRSQGFLEGQLIVHPTISQKNRGGIRERCSSFFELFEMAKNVFKSLADNALLKAWEFTLASFSETKYELARWNFYASLGLQTNEPGGIGQCIYKIIQQKLDLVNQKTEEIQYEYERVYTEVKTLEARMQHASTEQEIQWLKMDYQSRRNEFYFLEEQRNEAQHHASELVNLYDALYKLYVELFKDYFQEVYDADVQEVTIGPFDDSPAGFRLLYKHGRSHTSQWTRIHNQREFIDALVSFFVATEPQIAHPLDGKKIEKDLSDVLTGMINHVKTQEFLESAFHRMAIAHNAPLIKDPLEHLEHIEKKPWVYTSGGTMNTLVSCYYRMEEKPREAEKWVESEIELLVFLADTLKQIPPRLIEPYLKNYRHSMLMQSPTHAFLLKPMISPFKETWMNDEFTYTFIRDRFVRPAESFIERLLLNDDMVRYLIERIAEKIPENFQPRFKALFREIRGPLNPIFFREFLVDRLEHDHGLRYGSRPLLAVEEIDHLLYSLIPLFPIAELKNRLQQILTLLPRMTSIKVAHVLELFDQIPLSRLGEPIMGANQLQNICKALLCLSEMRTTTSDDLPLHIAWAAQKLRFSMPAPLIFADTNWVKEMFGFVVNPGTGKLELWRLDYTGSSGYPMTSWKQWVDGSRPDLKWGVYIRPFEYGQA